MIYIKGIGRTKFGKSSKTIYELLYESITKSLTDSELSIKDIDLIYVSSFGCGQFNSQLHLNSIIASLIPNLHIPIIRIESACASGGTASFLASLTLDKFENVMVVGIEKMTLADNLECTTNISMAGDRIVDQNSGLIFPANYALIAQQYMIKFGLTIDDLSMVSLKNHNNANLNELAHFYSKKVNMDMIMKSQVICSPLRLFDCSPISDGASTIILSKNRQSRRDIKVLASSMSTDAISLSQRNNITSFKAVKLAAKKAYKQAKVRPVNIDIAEVHDCFTISEIIAMEDLGFCKEGDSKYFVRNNETTLSGKIPINTDGGLKADGHPIGATGIAQIYEIVTQLRGEAGKRQIDNCKLGLTHNVGGIGGTAVIHILSGEES